jgi:hypothetical protein
MPSQLILRFPDLGMSASPRQETLFSAFYALTDLEDAHERKPMPIALLTATANRAMETLGAVIQSMLPPYLSTRSPTKTLHMISTMLSYLLSVILPLLIVDPKVDGRLTVQDLAVDADQFLRRFATVYTSIIRSFEPVSRSTLWSVFSIQGNSKNDVPLSGNDPLSVDELLALLRRAVSILDQVHSHTGCKLIDGLKDHLGLEALRELEKASLRPNRDGRPCSQVRCLPEERVSLLVNKDIIWYMCNILHLMFTPTLAHSEFARHFPFVQDDLLKNGIMGIISGIILHSRLYVKAGSITSNGILNQGRPLLDEVGHGMAIAVAEKVWLRWFGVGGQTSLRPDS